MRVALTGGSGFIGRQARQVLEARGFMVSASDATSADGVQCVDLRDVPALRAWLRESRAECLIHAGGISGVMVGGNDAGLISSVNVDGTRNVLIAMEACGIHQMVLLSSIAVYASRADRSPVKEDYALGAHSAYGQSKIEAEALVHDAVTKGVLGSACTLRLSSVYGRGRKTPYLLSYLAQCAAARTCAEVTDESCNMRQFIHIDDAVSSLLLAIAEGPDGFQPFNITGGTYLSEDAIARLVARFIPELTWRIVKQKEPGDGEFGPLDIERAGQLLHYQPKVSLEHGLTALYSKTP